jgi:GNAT superfamily N-acetyltransferase
LVAVAEQDGKPVIAGGGRYIVIKPGQAEVAFAVVDQFQGQGIGTALLQHLSSLAREAGLREFVAEVLPENAMLKVFEKSELEVATRREPQAIHVVLRLP